MCVLECQSVVCSFLGIVVGILHFVCICVVSCRRCLAGVTMCGMGWCVGFMGSFCVMRCFVIVLGMSCASWMCVLSGRCQGGG